MKGGGRSGTILVIDNDPSSRQLIKLHLGNAGYVLEADLPFMSGLELIATLAVDQSAPAMPVVFLASNDEDRARGRGAPEVGPRR